MTIPSFKLKMLSNGKLLMVGGKLSTNLDCCCESGCPCCYTTFQILRGDGDTVTLRTGAFSVECTGVDGEVTGAIGSFLCGDEMYDFGGAPITSGTGCTCLRTATITTEYYGELVTDPDSPCYQQYQTVDEQTCSFNPPGPGTGFETHTGAVNFRETITLSLCYDPCGTITVSINHKVHARWGVIRDSQPPPIAGAVVLDFYETDADELILDATWAWTGVACPNCEELPDLGAPTYTPAAAFTKTWGAPYINSTYCGTPSSFTITIPGSCAATGLVLYGSNGTPCDCG